MKNAFTKKSPLVLLTYFAFMFVLSCTLSPFYLIIILVSHILYMVSLEGKSSLKSTLLSSFFIISFVGIFNMLFVRKGDTVLFSAFNIDFTFEALAFGFSQGIIFANIVVLLMLYGKVVGSDKLISVFGRVTPYIALLFSMVLSLISRFRQDSIDIRSAKIGLNEPNKDSKLKSGVNTFSALVTKSLEGSIVASDSMKARGYNNKDFKMSSKIKLNTNDVVLLIIVIALFAVQIINFSINGKGILFEPKIIIYRQNILSLCLCGFFSLLPIIVDFTEGVLWQLSRRKI